MGQIRKRDFDAVIGIGGLGREPCSHNFDRKLHWIGVGPTKLPAEKWMRGPFVVFDRYIDFGSAGPRLEDIAPKLATRLYSSRLRHQMDGFDAQEEREIKALLKLAPRRVKGEAHVIRRKKCKPKRRTQCPRIC